MFLDESGANTDMTRLYARAEGGARAVDSAPRHSSNRLARLFSTCHPIPDLNPIGQMWSKIKAFLRKVKARSVDLLIKAIPDAFRDVSTSDISNWFKCAGYCT